jgi:hypothetical protein
MNGPVVIVTGLTLKDYGRRGSPVPLGHVKTSCLKCYEPVIISHEGAEHVRAARRRSDLAAVLCNRCACVLAVTSPVTAVMVTAAGQKSIDKDAESRHLTEFMKSRISR